MLETNCINPWQEQAFWLEILEDHAYFIRDHLSPSEQGYVDTANQYINAFSRLRKDLVGINENLTFNSDTLIEFAIKALPVAQGYFQFEGLLQSLRMQNKVNLNLSPSYLNGTLGENQEYLRILNCYARGQDFPPLSLVDLLDLWLTDQLGHAILFRNVLDPVELELLNQTEIFINKFQGYIVQNRQMRAALRFSPTGFPRQQRLSHQIGLTTIDMYKFIQEAINLYMNKQVFTRTTLRFLEHHFPETCYFIKKLSKYAPEFSREASICPLTKPMFM